MVMIMADVYTVTFSLIGILLSLPALLVAINLLMPKVTQRVQTRLEQTPGRSFVLGVPVTAAFALWIAVTSQLPGVGQAMAFIAAALFMGLGTIGGAGLARLLGDRIRPLARSNSELTSLVRGAVVYELAALVPIVGWFLFIPLAGIMAVGAAAFALVNWLPSPAINAQISQSARQPADS
jgi:Na+/melibiose symporter-like transporter